MIFPLALCALLVRVLWFAIQGPTEITWDGAEYARAAFNLLHGHGFIGIHGTPMVIFPPLYTLLIAAIMPLVGNAETAGIVVSLVAGAALVFPVYGIAKRLYSPAAALIAGVIAAFLPFAVDVSVLVLSDSLFALLAAFALYFLIRTVQDGRMRDAAVAGALFGLAYLTRPEGLVLGLAGAVAVACAFVLIPALRRRLTTCTAVYVVALAVVAAPYVGYLSTKAHALRLEGKSAINATIAERMRSGLDYVQAADAIDEQLGIIGPELDDDGYFADRWVRTPSLQLRLSLIVTDARRRLFDVPRTLVTAPYGTPVLPLLAVLGLVANPWTRRRTVAEIAMLGYAIALFLSLTTVYHFWARYAFGFTPLVAIWAGHGIDVALRWAAVRFRMRTPAAAPVLVIALACVFILGTHRSWFREAVNDATPLSEREAGTWIATQDSAPGRILSVSDQSVYYAHGEWSMLPYSPRADLALAYVRQKAPRYLVLDRFEADERPYISDWLAHGVPDAGARLVHSIGDPHNPDVAIYRWSSNAQAEAIAPRNGDLWTNEWSVSISALPGVDRIICSRAPHQPLVRAA